MTKEENFESKMDIEILSLEELQQQATQVKEKLEIGKNNLIQNIAKKEKLKQRAIELKGLNNGNKETQYQI